MRHTGQLGYKLLLRSDISGGNYAKLDYHASLGGYNEGKFVLRRPDQNLFVFDASLKTTILRLSL